METVRQRLEACKNSTETVQVLLTLREEDQVMIACMLWKWWDRRNRLNANEKVVSVEATAAHARAWAVESQQYNKKLRTEMPVKTACRWNRPADDLLKINMLDLEIFKLCNLNYQLYLFFSPV